MLPNTCQPRRLRVTRDLADLKVAGFVLFWGRLIGSLDVFGWGNVWLLAQKKRREIDANISIVPPDGSVLNQRGFMTDGTTASLVTTTFMANLALWRCCGVTLNSFFAGVN